MPSGKNDPKTDLKQQAELIKKGICPSCSRALVHLESCIECPNCGWSGCEEA